MKIYKKVATSTVSLAILCLGLVMIGTVVPKDTAQAYTPPPPSQPCPPQWKTTVMGRINEVVGSRMSGGQGPTPYLVNERIKEGNDSEKTTIMSCDAYSWQEQLGNKLLRGLRNFAVMGIIGALENLTQKLAVETAHFIVDGAAGRDSVYFKDSPGRYLEKMVSSAADSMVSAFDEQFMRNAVGFSLCDKPKLGFQLFLGIGRLKPVPPPGCDWDKITKNFEAINQSLSQNEMRQMALNMVKPGGNDLSIYTSLNLLRLNRSISAREGARLDRQEGQGIKPIKRFLDGNISVPTVMVKNKLEEEGPSSRNKEKINRISMATTMAALSAGFEELPGLFAMSFLNTLASDLLKELFALFEDDQSEPPLPECTTDKETGKQICGNETIEVNNNYGEVGPDTLSVAEGTLPDVVGSEVMNPGGGRGDNVPSALSDILAARVFTSEKQDLLLEMSTCLTPRGLWGCTLDQAFVEGLRLRGSTGAMTVGRAAGLGAPQGVRPFIHLDWQLIPANEAKDNQDKGCYQRAYCAANLAKLRFARILPIGWELAANSAFNKKQNGKYVTLGDVMRGYNVCNESGMPDADHPWCKLIDPNWVLVAPGIQCNVKGFGSTVLDPAVPMRVEECSELVSCVQTNDKGECIGGYGACLSDKTVWRFGGTSCQEKYVSCRAYKTRGGQDASYVRNTIDYGSCNSTNVGCWAYANTRDMTTTTADVWVNSTAEAATGQGYSLTGPRVYLTAQAQACSSSDDGCTKTYKTQDGQAALNLVRNSSFESESEKADTKLDGWKNDLSGMGEVDQNVRFIYTAPSDVRTIAGASAYMGNKAAYFWNAVPPRSTYQMIDMQPLRNYTVSFYARRIRATENAEVTVRMRLLKSKSDPSSVVDAAGVYYRSESCKIDNTAQFGVPVTVSDGTLGDDWQRYTCEFVSNPGTAAGRLMVRGLNAAVDSVQLEEQPFATTYVDGVNTALQEVHLKLAPEELACSGDTAKDRKECAKYARVCQQADMGCAGYKEVDGVSPVEIPAKLTQADYCPSSCAGYADYRKLPSTFDLVNTGAAVPSEDLQDDPNDDTVATFVPSRSESCRAEDVGCEEFTSLESFAGGGEVKAYYSYGRACRKPSDPGSTPDTYFTWEGSDTTGYQLKTWALLKADTNGVGPMAPRILRKAGPDGLMKDPATCSESSWKVGSDLDCRQFYDSAGTAYYVYYSQTIVSTDACIDYRKNGSTVDDCKKTGGDYEAGSGSCIYHILPKESNSCKVEAAGCRAYIGAGGRNSSVVLRDTFVAADTIFVSSDASTKASISGESLLVGDKSLKVESSAAVGTVEAEVPSAANVYYTVSFWLKTTNQSAPQGEVLVNGKSVASFQTPVEWSRLEFGPFRGEVVPKMKIQIRVPSVTFIDEVQVASQLDTFFVKKDSWVVPAECDVTPEGIPQPKAMLGCKEYKDRNGDSVFAYRFSRLCRADSIGCSGFVDTRNSVSAYEESFVMKGVQNTVAVETRPGPPDADGDGFSDWDEINVYKTNPTWAMSRPTEAEALAATTAKTYKAWDTLYTGTVTTTRPADRYVYVIDEQKSRCSASADSCRGFGKAEFDTFGRPSGYTTVYLKDDITKYLDATGEPNMLCKPSELFCDAYTSKPQGTQQVQSFFRNPNKHVCVWKDRVPLEARTGFYPKGEYNGWFAAGTSPAEPCYPEKLSSGNTFLMEFSGSLQYRGWTSACPSDQGECTMFQDPNDRSDLSYPAGKPYFFLNNARIDKTSCDGKVDPSSGCVLLRDSTNPVMSYATALSYAKAHKEGDSPVTPVDCSMPGESDPGCTNPTGKPADRNDANLIVKVKLDRDCATWLGCRSGETLYDEAQGKYIDICSDYAVCSKVGSTNSQYCGEFIDRRPVGAAQVGVGYQEPVLREGLVIDQVTYAKRTGRVTDADYSGYTSPNQFQLVDLVSRPVGFDLLERFSDTVKSKLTSDYRLVAAVPILSDPPEFAALPGALPTDPANKDKVMIQVTGNFQTVCDASGTSCTTFPSDPENLEEVVAGASGIKPVVGKITKKPGARFVDPVTAAAPKGDEKNYAKYLAPDKQYPYLSLCQHVQTGMVGYYLASDNPRLCYLSVEKPPSALERDQFSTSTVSQQNAQNAAVQFLQVKQDELKLDARLSTAYPPSECKAYPSQDAPFPNQFIKSWDALGKPQQYAVGYDNVPYCEKGQDCDCTYRKATYAATNKYYSPFGTAPLGICTGGQNEGASCSPYQTDETTQVNPVCGEDAMCTNLEKSVLVQGLFGQCLQRDLTRTIAGTQSFNPCLVWNPLPSLRGQADVHHYSFTAGYIPMPNAGEYYCVSNMKAPVGNVMETSPWFTKADGTLIPGLVNTNVFTTSAPFIDPDKKITDQQQWLQTGFSDKSYSEYFVRFNGYEWAKAINLAEPTAPPTVTDLAVNPNSWKESIDIKNALEIRNFSQFVFSAPAGDSLTGAFLLEERKALAKKDFDGEKNFINVYEKQMLKDIDTTDLMKLPCVYAEGDDTKSCYYAYADMGYGAAGNDAFLMLNDQYGGQRSLIQPNTYLKKKAVAQKPYFAIRAMFENANDIENDLPVSTASDGDRLNGPWRFIGFWVTVSGDPNASNIVKGDVGAGENKATLVNSRGLLMRLTVWNAPICKDVAQVVSPNSRDATPFMDRIWEKAKYKLPVLNYIFKDNSSPFGSAPHSKPISSDPLFHPNVDLNGKNGSTASFPGGKYDIMATDAEQPIQNWGWLTNLFARVYRVYNFYDTPVTKASWACVAGPNFGSWCPNLSDYYDVATDDDVFIENWEAGTPAIKIKAEGIQQSRKYCGYDGTCKPLAPAELTTAQPRCNSLSGVNSGLACSGDTNDEVSGYHACHAAPLKRVQGNLVPQYTTCELAPGYLKLKGGRYQAPDGTRYDEGALPNGALRCAGNAVKYPNGDLPVCKSIAKISKECPIEVEGGEDSSCVNNKCSGGYESASCNTDKDCEFTWFEWWGGAKESAPKPYDAGKLISTGQVKYTALTGTPPSLSPWPSPSAPITAPYSNPLDVSRGAGANILLDGRIYPQTEIISNSGPLNNVNHPWLGTALKDITNIGPVLAKWWVSTSPATLTTVSPNLDLDRVMNKDIAGYSFDVGRYAVLYRSSSFFKRFPGAYVAYPLGNLSSPSFGNISSDLGIYIPGHCERPPIKVDAPAQVPYELGPRYTLQRVDKVTHPSVQSYWKPWTPGKCDGGVYDGKLCVENNECSPSGVSSAEKARASLYCQPVTGPDGKPRNVKFHVSKVENEYIFNCLNPNGDAKAADPDLDDNLCTHGTGYYPRADLCGGVQDKPECLSAMAHGDGQSADVAHSALPTDVTNGLFSPTFLGQKFSSGKLNPFGGIDDRYVSYYVPRPPTVAAPDTARKCASPGKCPISELGAFTFENQSDGVISFGGGQAQSSIKFYAWAADDQGPLKDLSVDWGDNAVQKIDSSRMKNRKPMCDKPKECQFVPGLVCGSDKDCPVGGGNCVSTGFCSKHPNVRCSRNEDCFVGNTLTDTCEVRTTFGNSKEACDESYFEFSHIYNCTTEHQQTLPNCGTQMRCSRDPNRNCSLDSDCAPGDSCRGDLAPSGGCFDAAKTACRYTPRVMVADNWGWCTGECRLQVMSAVGSTVGGSVRMGDAFTAPVSASNRGIENYMLFSNGGCYNGSKLTYNDTYKMPFAVGQSTRANASGNIVMTAGGTPALQSYSNACDAKIRGSHFRPWIVFQGALELGLTSK